ncbi:MAG: T9SS type A sorting domain-containing protein [Bacteroidales bacterium]|nr:T9SS type A sorting domain-containing protein [Bacteroidales bacterium]
MKSAANTNEDDFHLTGQSPTAISDLPHAGKPEYLPGPAYPNPFQSSTSFQLHLPVRSSVVLTIHNISGDVVTTLVSGEMAAGTYMYNWHAYDLAGGIYLIKLQFGDFTDVRKIFKF